MTYEENKTKASIVTALSGLDLNPDVIDDAVFHMTDWLSDLNQRHSFCENPDSLSSDEIQD